MKEILSYITEKLKLGQNKSYVTTIIDRLDIIFSKNKAYQENEIDFKPIFDLIKKENSKNVEIAADTYYKEFFEKNALTDYIDRWLSKEELDDINMTFEIDPTHFDYYKEYSTVNSNFDILINEGIIAINANNAPYSHKDCVSIIIFP